MNPILRLITEVAHLSIMVLKFLRLYYVLEEYKPCQPKKRVVII